MTDTLSYRHLFGPGPSNCYPEAISALGHPVLGHLDPLFLEVMDRTCEGLRKVWGPRILTPKLLQQSMQKPRRVSSPTLPLWGSSREMPC